MLAKLNILHYITLAKYIYVAKLWEMSTLSRTFGRGRKLSHVFLRNYINSGGPGRTQAVFTERVTS